MSDVFDLVYRHRRDFSIMNIIGFGFGRRYGWRATAAVVLVGSMLGCGTQPETVPPAPPEVTVATPDLRDVE